MALVGPSGSWKSVLIYIMLKNGTFSPFGIILFFFISTINLFMIKCETKFQTWNLSNVLTLNLLKTSRMMEQIIF